MMIPHQMLSPEALQGVIKAFVTREGTDYGTQDVSLATTVWQVLATRCCASSVGSMVTPKNDANASSKKCFRARAALTAARPRASAAVAKKHKTR